MPPSDLRRVDHWKLRTRTLTVGKLPLLMGIINVTPDSFSDGGHCLRRGRRRGTRPAAGRRGRRHARHRRREHPALWRNPSTCRRNFAASCPSSGRCAGKPACPSRSTPPRRWSRACDPCRRGNHQRRHRAGGRSGHAAAGGRNGLRRLRHAHAGHAANHAGRARLCRRGGRSDAYLRGRRDALLAAGVAQDRIALDPGIGFGKTTEHNLQLLANAWRFHELGCPVLVGHSRKRFLGRRGWADVTSIARRRLPARRPPRPASPSCPIARPAPSAWRCRWPDRGCRCCASTTWRRSGRRYCCFRPPADWNTGVRE